jgi:hypothetical protein
VRAGYASVLASRALGRAILLRPITPSRFESGAQSPDLHHDDMVGQQVDTAPAVGGSEPLHTEPVSAEARAAPEPARPAEPDDAPLLGFRQPDALHDLFPGRLADRRAPAGPPTPRDHHGQRRTLAPRATTADPAMPSESAAPSEPAPPPPDDPVVLGEAPWAVEVTRAVRDVASSAHEVAAHHVDQDDRSGPTAEPAAAEPPIVVRIGRLDVRAVHAPLAASPEVRPRRAVGPTLEERLAARDRR